MFDEPQPFDKDSIRQSALVTVSVPAMDWASAQAVARWMAQMKLLTPLPPQPLGM